MKPPHNLVFFPNKNKDISNQLSSWLAKLRPIAIMLVCIGV